jgi:flagellin
MASIGTNVAAVNATFYLTVNNDNLTKSIRKLASGSRLADPVDDAAGVAVSANLTARVMRLNAAVEGAQNIISYAQTSDGFLQTVQDQLTRMSELAQRATNGAFSDTDRANYNIEFERLKTQILSISTNATYNGTTIFTTGTISVAISADGTTDTLLSSSLGNLTTLGLTGSTIGSTTSAGAAISTLALAIQSIARRRAEVNADVSKFQFHIQNIRSESINVATANSRIKDLDVAQESTELSKNNILLQASTSMLAQANSAQQSILALLS